VLAVPDGDMLTDTRIPDAPPPMRTCLPSAIVPGLYPFDSGSGADSSGCPTITGDIVVSGATAPTATLDVTAGDDCSYTFTFTFEFPDSLTVTNLTVTGDLNVEGDTTLDGDLNVFGTTTLDGPLFVNNTATFDGDVIIEEGHVVNINSPVTIDADFTIEEGWTVIINSPVTIDADFTIEEGWTVVVNSNTTFTADVSFVDIVTFYTDVYWLQPVEMNPVTKVCQPYVCTVSNEDAQTVPDGDTDTPVELGITVLDPYGMRSGWTDTTSVPILRSGPYMLEGYLAWASPMGGTNVFIGLHITRNGTALDAGERKWIPGENSQNIRHAIAAIWLDGGDVIALTTNHSNGSDATLEAASCRLSVVELANHSEHTQVLLPNGTIVGAAYCAIDTAECCVSLSDSAGTSTSGGGGITYQCTSCPNGAPRQFRLSTAGITDGSCSDCESANGTFTLTQTAALYCVWESASFTVCGVNKMWQMSVVSSGGSDLFVNLSLLNTSGGLGVVANWYAVVSGRDCLVDLTVPLQNNFGQCSNIPATMTVSPIL
jgi:hypothetical protein